jgi:undecaprenyl-diphosphatase
VSTRERAGMNAVSAPTTSGGAPLKVIGRFGRRALLRASLAATAAVVATLPGRRHRGLVLSAGTLAAIAGASQERPALTGPGVVAGTAVLARYRPRAAAAVVGGVAGASIGLASRRVWPVAPRTPALVRRSLTPRDSRPVGDGAGVAVVVNAAAGSSDRGLADEVRDLLPAADVIEVSEGRSLEAALDDAAGAEVIGIAGGDGSINAAAGVAHAAGTPLLVIPAGTRNHFARDLGVTDAEEAVAALHDGHAVAVDVSTIDGRPFLNTASIGVYSDLVDARERLESTIGKWPALLVALARMLRSAEPIDVELDGRRRRVWMVFVGNCRYEPPGFAPAWRERLDDGLLDVRLVDGTHPFARLSLLLAVVTGRLRRCRAYEEFTTRELRVRAESPLRLARDGETFDGAAEFVVAKQREPLTVYAPRPDDDSARSQRPSATSNPRATTEPTTASQSPARSYASPNT